MDSVEPPPLFNSKHHSPAQPVQPVNSALVKCFGKLSTEAKSRLFDSCLENCSESRNWHSKIKTKYFSTAIMLLV